MATSFQRRPGDKTPNLPASATRMDPALEAEVQKAEAQRRALEQRGGDAELDAELVAKMQPAMGNSAVQALLNRGTDTTTAGADTGLEQRQGEEEEGEEKDDLDANELEQVLPSFSTGGGGGGGGGGGTNAPWAMGRDFGGDDDAEAAVVDAAQPRWRPMPFLPDPDDDLEIDDVEGDEPEDRPGALDLRGAESALGPSRWEPSLIGRGMRHVRRLASPEFGPESLVDREGVESALGRLRTLLRFLARHADLDAAALLARAAARGGEAVFPVAAGFSGATARAAALAEATLALLPAAWGPVLEVALDPRGRPRAERAASELVGRGILSSPLVFLTAIGEDVAAVETELSLDAHPGAVAALEACARTDALPLFDLWEPSAERAPVDAEVDAIDAVLARFTGGAPAPRAGISAADIARLAEPINHLVGGFGAIHVEMAAAATSAAPFASHGSLAGVLAVVDAQLRRGARRLISALGELESLVGGDGFDRVRAISAEALAVRAAAELLRRGALGGMARLLLDAPARAPSFPLAGAEEALARGKTMGVRAAAAGAGRSLRARFHAGSLLLRAGFPDEAAPHFAAAARLPGPLGLGACSIGAGLHLSRGRWAEARSVGIAQMRRSRRTPFLLVDAAMTVASAEAQLGADWRRGLRRAARAVDGLPDQGAAANLLKARWAELAAAGRRG